MKNTDQINGGFSNRDIRNVVLLLLKSEAMLMVKMKSKKEHPDAAFTIQLKESNLQIRALLNAIMEDELIFVHAEKEGMINPMLFLDRIGRIAGNAQALLQYIESFQFVSSWISECIEKIVNLSSLYAEDK